MTINILISIRQEINSTETINNQSIITLCLISTWIIKIMKRYQKQGMSMIIFSFKLKDQKRLEIGKEAI